MSDALSRVEGILSGDSSIEPQSRVEALLIELIESGGGGGGDGVSIATVRRLISEAIGEVVDNAPSGLDTLNELATAINALITQLSGKQDQITFDTMPARNSLNPVTSGGLFTIIMNLEDRVAALEEGGGGTSYSYSVDSEGYIVINGTEANIDSNNLLDAPVSVNSEDNIDFDPITVT